jgi:hypothetical protein
VQKFQAYAFFADAPGDPSLKLVVGEGLEGVE